MKIVIVDDEQKALNLLKIMVERYTPSRDGMDIVCFQDSEKALDFLLNNDVDIAFLDIEMPEITGMDIAEKLMEEGRKLPEVVFVTAYPQYSLKAWQVEALGYILKPFSAAQIYSALDRAQTLHPKIESSADFNRSEAGDDMNGPAENADRPWQSDLFDHKKNTPVKVVCFPNFNVFVDKKPINFHHQKSKELLAFLVHNKGGWVSVEMVIGALLENAEERSSKNYCRIIAYRLKQALEAAGASEIFETAHGKFRAVTEYMDCDYYKYLEGHKELYRGSYLDEYIWASGENKIMKEEML